MSHDDVLIAALGLDRWPELELPGLIWLGEEGGMAAA